LFYYFQEPQFLRSPTFNIKEKEDLQSIQSRVTFLENLVCSKMTNLNLSNQFKSKEEDVDVPKAEDPVLVEEKVIFNSNSVILRYFFTF